MLLGPFFDILLIIWQGSGWKIVSCFEGRFPDRMKQLPLDRHFDINNVKRVSFEPLFVDIFFGYYSCLPFVSYQIVLEADGYQPYLISPEKGLRSLIKGVLELAKEPSRLCVDEVIFLCVEWTWIIFNFTLKFLNDCCLFLISCSVFLYIFIWLVN